MKGVVKVLPAPEKDEEEKDFVARFMSDDEAAEEFPKREQRFAVAMSVWRKHTKAIEKRLALWGSTAGKTRLAKRVIPMIPEHKTYVEPFAGGAAIFYAKPKEMSSLEVLADTNPEVAFSFKFIRDMNDADAKAVRAKNWVVSKDQARRVHELKPSNNPDRFYRFAYKRYALFFGREDRITAIDPMKAGKKPTLINNLERTKERLKGVKVHNDSYEKVVKAHDSKDTFFYLDPPYPRCDQGVGEKIFDEAAFIKTLQKMKGKFLLHYDYRDKSKFLNKGWTVKVITATQTMSPKSNGAVTGKPMAMAGKLLEVTNFTPTKKAEPGSSEDDADQSQPALPDERRTGSRRNPRGSAATEGGKIELSAATNKTLQTKLDTHNEKVGDDKTKRTTLRALQAVYRRGAGAFSVSHRPGMTRAQWAFARVNHFLHLLETGKPKDSKYITDNDLLPEGHPAVKKSEGFVPPKAVRDEAAKGLELRRRWDRGGLSVQQAAEEGVGSGVQRAVNLKNGDRISLDTISKMRGFFSRHKRNFKPDKKMPDGGPTAGTIAWYLWGGTPGREWADKIWKEQNMQKAEFSCPLATQNLELNTKNRNKAIEAEYIQYGPLNLSDKKYWEKLAVLWDTDVDTAQKSKCKNCAAFDVSPQMQECMPGSIQKDGFLGYCHMHHFKCHSERTCRTWAAGGPIETNEVSTSWHVPTEKADLNWTMPIIKKDDDERIVTGIVLEPDEVDAQGDTVSKEAIKEAAYRFLAKFNKDTELGFMHKAFGNLGMSLVESWIAREDKKYDGSLVKSGSWLMSVRIDKNDALWEKIKAGKISGFSIGGVARVS